MAKTKTFMTARLHINIKALQVRIKNFKVRLISSGANAVMINYDDTSANTAAAQSIVLVGLTSLTSITDGVITV